MTTPTDELKRQAGEYAVTYVHSNMIIGLGAGTTAIWVLRKIAELIKNKKLTNVRCVPCSKYTETQARALDLPIVSLEEYPQVDLTIDGADEVSPSLDLIKGGGGALLREKIVAQASKQEIIVIDESKMSSALGSQHSVPVEIFQFGWKSQVSYLTSLGAEITIRQISDGTPWLSDQGNMIADCNFGVIAHPSELASTLSMRAGIVEHGLFLNRANKVVVSGKAGIQILTKDGK
jgi:ribose 5-phosphate isomerase A